MFIAPNPLRTVPAFTVVSNPVIGHDASGSPVRVAFAAISPSCGIALLDTADAPTPNATAHLALLLDAAGFSNAHSGHLPILYRTIRQIDGQHDLTMMADDLDIAFATEPPITLPNDPDGTGWTRDLARILTDGVSVMPLRMLRADAARRFVSHSAMPRRTKVALAVGAVALMVGGAATVVHQASPPPLELREVSVPPARPPSPAPRDEETPAVALTKPFQPASPVPVLEPTPLPVTPNPTPASTPLPPPATAPVAAPPPVASAPSKRLASQVSIATAIRQAQAYMAQHDITSARAWYELAFNAGDGIAAVSLGQTFDAAGDHATAQLWYDKARAAGGPEVDFALRMAAGMRQRP